MAGKSASFTAKPLHIAIIGAGIGGFAVATGLRKQGHIVEVFEASSFSREFGAAVGIPPNATSVLNHLGCNFRRIKAVEYFGSLSTDCSGDEPSSHTFSRDSKSTWGHKWFMCHRVDLHNELRVLATSKEGPGTPAKLHLSSGAIGCDPKRAILTLQNGQTRQFDLIIGADGIRSKIRTSVVGFPVIASPAPIQAAAFRWVMPASVINGNSDFDWIMKEGIQGGRAISSKDGHFLLIYPCRDKNLINSIAIHIDHRDQTKVENRVPATREELLEVFKDYAPKYKAWMNLAEGINLWQLRTLPALHTWVNGNTCLLGDAAHAMFPTMGQGAGMVMEDAAVLASLLPLGTTPAQINTRLRAYQHLRKGRTEFIAKEAQEQAIYSFKHGFYHNSPGFQDFIMCYNAPKVGKDYYDEHFAGDCPAMEPLFSVARDEMPRARL